MTEYECKIWIICAGEYVHPRTLMWLIILYTICSLNVCAKVQQV